MVALAAEHVGVTLAGRPVVRDISTRLSPGTLVGILGPNGAGKSSLMKALAGLLPHSGKVFLDDVEIPMLSRNDIARKIAYLPQGQTLHWPLAVERLVGLGRLPHLAPLSAIGAEDRAAVQRAMQRADVLHLASRPATELSGGERARVMLARALAVEAPVLLADEPLANLDPAHQIAGMELLRAEAEAGVLVLAALHDLSLAYRHCDHILLLQEGSIVAQGPAETALTAQTLARVYGITARFGLPGERLLMPLDRIR